MSRGNPKGEVKKAGMVSCPVAFCSWYFTFDLYEANAFDKAKAEERKHWTEYHEKGA